MSTANLTDAEKQALDFIALSGDHSRRTDAGQSARSRHPDPQDRPEGAESASHQHISANEEPYVVEPVRAVEHPATGARGRSDDSQYMAELFGVVSALEDVGLVCSVPRSQAELDQRTPANAPDPTPTVLSEAYLKPSRADVVGAFDAMKQAGWLR